MKIVRIDNYDREGFEYNDVLIAENISQKYSQDLVDFLNDKEPQGLD